MAITYFTTTTTDTGTGIVYEPNWTTAPNQSKNITVPDLDITWDSRTGPCNPYTDEFIKYCIDEQELRDKEELTKAMDHALWLEDDNVT